jgi:hypothetical protein
LSGFFPGAPPLAAFARGGVPNSQKSTRHCDAQPFLQPHACPTIDAYESSYVKANKFFVPKILPASY